MNQRAKTLWTMIGVATLVIAVLLGLNQHSGPIVETPTRSAIPTPITVPAPTPPPEPKSPWTFDADVNQLDGTRTIYASDGDTDYGGAKLVLRRRGTKLECFVQTDHVFLETVESMHGGGILVKYKFDSGQIAADYWDLGTNNTSFFSRSPAAFLKKLRTAKQLVMEYPPADYTPKTIILDVSLFPSEFK
jgi:hypothetical protein